MHTKINRRTLLKGAGALLAAPWWGKFSSYAQMPFFRAGWVKQDHHTAMFVAALEWEYFRDTYGIYLEPIRERELFKLMSDGAQVAEVELLQTQGASNMPKNMAQGQFEFGLGGHAAVVFFVDQAAPLRMVAPMHSEGAALVMKPDFPANTWQEFVVQALTTQEQIRIGYKSPTAVHQIILERAMQYEGVDFTEDASNQFASVLMINMKEEGNLIPGLSNDIIDGFVVNQPTPALAEFNGVGKIIAPLQELPPPGWWEDHPCCIAAARDDFIAGQFDVGTKFMEVMYLATRFINENPQRAMEIASQWLGTPLEVEQISLPTSSFSMEPTPQWYNSGHIWFQAMKDLGRFTNLLANKTPEEADALAYNFSMLDAAFANLQAKGFRS